MSAAKKELVLTKQTDEKGGFKIKSLLKRFMQLSKKSDYKEQMVTVAVNNGKMGGLNIEFSKN